MYLRRILPISICIAIVAAIGAYIFLGKQEQEQKQRRARALQDQPAPVLVARAITTDVPVYLDAVGNTKALNTATVTPQVTGQIVKVAFREGQDVKRGDTLAEIDPRTYQAQYDQSVAKKAQDEATLANARIDLERYTKLAASNSGSKQQADTQKALVAQLEAQVQGDQGAIDNAKTMLSYTKIIAPFDGRTGIRLIDEGNLVQPSTSNGIVVITQIQPISVLFNLPQQQYPQVSKAFIAGPLPVDALAADGSTKLDNGTLQVIDNQMDQTTGTIRMKAEFPNRQLQLWPGQFVNIRMLVDTLRQAITVPTAAVQRGPNGTFVYVVDGESKAVVRPIKVTMLDDTRAVISDGLKNDERVVTTGFTRLSNGTKVNVQEGDGQPQPTAAPDGATPAAAAAPEGGRGEGRRKRDGAAKGEAKGGDGRGADGKEPRRRKSENAETTPNPPSAKQ
jgi:multidrug efflux system membrane fusion protein